jgi:hypothetical protein
MELEGVQMSEARHHFGGPAMMWGGGSSRARGVLCRLPPRENRDRVCEVKAYEAKATFKMNNKRRSDAALEEVAKRVCHRVATGLQKLHGRRRLD